MDIELLVTPDCPNEAVAAELISTAVADTGVSARVIRTIIANQDEAERRGFTGSPTILLNGCDPFARAGASPAFACRLYVSSEGGMRGAPELRDLRQAIKRTAAG